MKKLILLSIALMMFGGFLSAKPIAWSVSGNAEIGRPHHDCNGVWLCISNVSVSVGGAMKPHSGMLTGLEHGYGLGEDGKLYLIVSEKLLSQKQQDKLDLFQGNSTIQIEEETIPQAFLEAIHFRGSGQIKAGRKILTYENGYYFIQLN